MKEPYQFSKRIKNARFSNKPPKLNSIPIKIPQMCKKENRIHVVTQLILGNKIVIWRGAETYPAGERVRVDGTANIGRNGLTGECPQLIFLSL